MKTEPTHSLSNVLEKASTYIANKSTLEKIKRAYLFARAAHFGQTRHSGEAYITHPLAVAMVLVELKMDAASIIAGLLHDTVEDTRVTLVVIQSVFGKEVVDLVDGVTKLSKISFKTREEKQAENFRKMLLAMSKDIRVIFIKVADRLSNMRTLNYLPIDKQKHIAQETLDIYAPIANRLGIGSIKFELEDLCLKYLEPQVHQELSQKISKTKQEREAFIGKICKILKSNLYEYQIKALIFGRAKHLYSIHRKMQRRQVAFEEVYDIIAFRIVVSTIDECYKVLGVIHSFYKPLQGRFKDYIAIPKSNSYQSLHSTVIGPGGERIEIQIRTYEMQRIAESGLAAHWKYKEGRFDIRSYANIDWVNRLLEWHKDLSDPQEFLETVKIDLFSEDVFVFTPKGEVKKLPFDSTPVDFAYAVHTNVGHQCVGAKVNERLVPLKTHLKSGDVVKILTSAHQTPSKDWLSFVKSSKAKARIRAFFKTFEAYAMSTEKPLTHHTLTIKLPEKTNVIKTKFDSTKHHLIIVDGMSNISFRLSKCCYPIPGDTIKGFVIHKQEVSVHLADCKKLVRYEVKKELPVEWADVIDCLSEVKIKINSLESKNVLPEVSQLCSKLNVNITHAKVQSRSGQIGVVFLRLLVKSVIQLDQIIKQMNQLKSIVEVTRVQN
jgi:guanosine-3',5'-bis(diphosphate) 3'-pyrophosphohydrolase